LDNKGTWVYVGRQEGTPIGWVYHDYLNCTYPAAASFPQFWECGLIQVSPPDRDSDPGFKINLDFHEPPFNARHTVISGRVFERADQYDVQRTRTDRGSGNFNWFGRSYKNPAITIVGTFGNNRATNLRHAAAGTCR
jgi:hypothetical protein